MAIALHPTDDKVSQTSSFIPLKAGWAILRNKDWKEQTMKLEPEVISTPTPEAPEYAELPARKPLELLRDTEALLRRPTVETLTPILPAPMATRLQDASCVAEESLNQLAEIDLEAISDEELRPARILVGLTFVGFGALAILLLLLYLNTIHPEVSLSEAMRNYWYEYVWFVCLGVAGMFILGREAMRPLTK